MGTRDSAVVTVVTRNYLHYARALVASIREQEDNIPVVVCLVDRPDVPLADAELGIEYIYADALSVPDWARFAFQYSGFELSCALKPFILDHLAGRGFRRLVYLDADIQVYHPLDVVFQALESHAILVTPHLAEPLSYEGYFPVTKDVRWKGTYNAGFLALRVSDVALEFLAWWKQLCQRMCVVRPEVGLFVDQCWLDLVPALFGDVGIVRDPGWNVAYWNLPVRALNRDAAGRLLANGRPLVFFHFSGFDPDQPTALSRYAPGLEFVSVAVVGELVAEYLGRLEAARRHECEAWGYAFATLSDGTAIQPRWREAVRHGDVPPEIEDPFDVAKNDGLMSLFGLPVSGASAGQSAHGVMETLKVTARNLTPPILWRALGLGRTYLLNGWRHRAEGSHGG